MAEATGDPAILLAAHNALGVASFYGGEFEAALAHLERGIELYDPTAHSPNRSPAFRRQPRSGRVVHDARRLDAVGARVSGAGGRADAGGARAGPLDRPSVQPGPRAIASPRPFTSRRESATPCQEQAEQSVALSTEHGFGAVLMAANFHRGWVLAEQGRGEDGLALMREWVAACREIRSECLLPAYLAWLAEVYGEIGRPGKGLDLVR